jgi:DNA polymerase I-like protein with 3'-5' exonuclease and polymerase domains/uracil-DNA glycosylase
MLHENGLNNKIALVFDYPRATSFRSGNIIDGYHKDLIEAALLAVGLNWYDCAIFSVLDTPNPPHQVDQGVKIEAEFNILTTLDTMPDLKVVVAFGEYSMRILTGEKNLERKFLSLYKLIHREHWVIPIFHPERIQKEYKMNVFMKMAFIKVREVLNERYSLPRRNFIIDPGVEASIDYLDNISRGGATVAVDIETSCNQINTFGLAVSASEAIAIRTTTKSYGPQDFRRIFEAIARVLGNPNVKKIYQNNPYETQYFRRYGIQTLGIYHDTMWAQRILWPEFKMGLDMVGRMYTPFPYWKEDNKDWSKIDDWQRHLEYNCKDTTGTFAGAEGQERDLKQKDLWDVFKTIMAYAGPLNEMCNQGLQVDPKRMASLRSEVLGKLEVLGGSIKEKANSEGFPSFNPNSPKQKLSLLSAMKLDLYKEKGVSGQWRESTSQKCLKKMRLKYPEEPVLKELLEYSTLQKLKSSYLDVDYLNDTIHYSLIGAGTETLRWACKKDVWGMGFNAQTLPGGGKGTNFKKVIKAPPGRIFVNVDLKQAESRFVAYDACDVELIRMLENGEDVHKRVAAEIYQKPVGEITKSERQLGKKSGHGANYSMREQTFMDSCLTEMDLVISKEQATRILEAYHKVFPEIRPWQSRIRESIRKERRLTTPFGYYRYFYDRLTDDTFREAYAFRPQSTIPYITNQLMLHLESLREKLKFSFHLQVHDSLVISAEESQVDAIANECMELKNWHPEIVLPAGKLLIPIDIETGIYLGELTSWQ